MPKKKGVKGSRISVVLPYLSSSRCFELCLDCLKRNTVGPYEIASVIDCKGAYEAYNAAAAKGKGDVLVFLNDDMFVAPGWDKPIRAAIARKTIVTGYLVESGRHPVNHRNICQNFGMDPESFDEEGFRGFASELAARVPKVEVGLGWYMPFAVHREDFVPYDTTPGVANDAVLFGLFASRGYRFLRVASVAYHLQRMTDW